MMDRVRFPDTPLGRAQKAFAEYKQPAGDGDAPAPLEVAVQAALSHPAAFAQHDSLYLAVQDEIEHLRKKGDKNKAMRYFEQAARLQAILDAAGEKREVPDYGELTRPWTGRSAPSGSSRFQKREDLAPDLIAAANDPEALERWSKTPFAEDPYPTQLKKTILRLEAERSASDLSSERKGADK